MTLLTHRSILDPAVVISDHVFVLHQGGVGEHLVHGHLLVMAVLSDLLLGDLDGIDHAVKAMSGFLHHAELSTGYLGQLKEFFLIPLLNCTLIKSQDINYRPTV